MFTNITKEISWAKMVEYNEIILWLMPNIKQIMNTKE